MMKKIVLVTFCLLALISATFGQSTINDKPADETEKKIAKKANQRPAERPKKKEPYDEVDAKTMETKCVLIETEKGNVKLEMFPKFAPETVRNFLNLVATGALDTTTFSRVVPGFIIQGGDLYTSQNLTDDLKWRAIETIPDEPNLVKHERGIISMARSDKPNSASTSFFILLSASTYLDNNFAAFGKVTEGIETVETINKMKVENEKPKEPVRIKKASIFDCPIPETPTENKTDSEN